MKTYKFTIKGQEYEVSIEELNDNHLDVDVNGTIYQVELEEKVTKKSPKLVRKPVVNKPGEGKVTKSSGGSIKIKAPLPGNIFKINVKPGDKVIKGQTVMIMEAMKMENNINAEKEGTVTEIKVNIGDTVLQDDVLIEME